MSGAGRAEPGQVGAGWPGAWMGTHEVFTESYSEAGGKIIAGNCIHAKVICIDGPRLGLIPTWREHTVALGIINTNMNPG